MKKLRLVKTAEISRDYTLTEIVLILENYRWINSDFLSVYQANIGKESFFITASRNYFSGKEWEHVIVRPKSFMQTTPSYLAMSKIATAFFENEYCMQIIPSRDNYVSIEPFTLHLWNFKKSFAFNFDDIYRKIKDKKLKFHKRICALVTYDSNYNKCLAVISKKDWPPWNKIVDLKEEYLGKDINAIIINRGESKDIISFDSHKVLLIWDASDIELPPKFLV